MKKVTSLLLALALVLACCPVIASAEGDGLCAHHVAHDENCGYFAGAVCTHEHNEDCLVPACLHNHGECTYTEPQAAVDCDHDCADGTCSYRAAVEGVDCDCGAQPQHSESCASMDGESPCDCIHTLAHGLECAYVEAKEEIPCDHTHGECAYAEAVSGGWSCGHVCTQDTGCVTVNCAHEHGEDCGWQEAVSCAYLTNGCEECKKSSPSGEDGSLEGLTEEETCVCETACGGDNGISPDCSVCLEDFWNCIHFVPTCTCAEKCTEETINFWCPICGQEAADLTLCEGEDQGVTLNTYSFTVGSESFNSGKDQTQAGWNSEIIDFTAATGTLKLTNITYSSNYNYINVGGPLNLMVVVDNVLISTNQTAIHTLGDITISGGPLKIGGTNGIDANNKALIVKNATLDIDVNNTGIQAGSVAIENSTVTVDAAPEQSIVAGQLTIDDKSHVTVSNGISGATVTADGYSRNAQNGEFSGYKKTSEADAVSGYFEFVGRNHGNVVTTDNHETHTLTCACGPGGPIAGGFTYALNEETTITKACTVCNNEIVGTLTIAAPENLIYDGEAKVPALVKNGFGEVPIQYTAADGSTVPAGGPVNPGTYTASVTDGGVMASVTYTIRKTPTKELFTMTLPEALIYDGTAKSVTVESSAEGLGDFSVKYQNSDDEFETSPTDAGTYTVMIDVEEGALYESKKDLVLGEFTIDKANPSVENFTLPSNFYNGEEQSVSVTASTEGIGTFTVRYYDSNGTLLTSAPRNAGTYSVKVDVADGRNYNTAENLDLGAFTIARKEIHIADVAIKDKAYDGKADAEVTKVTLGGVIDGEALTLDTDFTVTAAFENASAGEDKPVTCTVTLLETAVTKNYTVASPVTATGTIHKAPVVLTADSHTVKTGSAMPALTFAVSGLVGQETAAVFTTQPSMVCDADLEKPGDYPITPGGAEAENYAITYQSGLLKVRDEFPVNVTVTDGGSVTVSPRSAMEGTVVTVTAEPKSGYRFQGLTVLDKDGKTIPATIDGKGGYVFTMPNGEVFVKASFTSNNPCEADPTNPKTGDEIFAPMAIMFLSAAALYVLTRKRAA